MKFKPAQVDYYHKYENLLICHHSLGKYLNYHCHIGLAASGLKVQKNNRLGYTTVKLIKIEHTVL